MIKAAGGVVKLNFLLSSIEKKMIDRCCEILEQEGFQYLSIPSTISFDTFNRQGLNTGTFSYSNDTLLSGSAEQGILEYFKGETVKPIRIYAKNACFRTEENFEDLLRLKEFYKVEQFVFCKPENWQSEYDLVLQNAIKLLSEYDIQHRIVDKTMDDGYHIMKTDIEVLTKKYGWVETHSCTYFGNEQVKRFDISGDVHTISCTGLAVPRNLIPIVEKLNDI